MSSRTPIVAWASALGLSFNETDIGIPAEYAVMRNTRLVCVATDEVVVPVRAATPHFRKVSRSTYRRLIQPTESHDKTHVEVIADLMDGFLNDTASIFSPTFDEAGTIDPNGQALLGPIKPGEYLWWDDTGGTRIPLGDGEYMQPDICGRPANPKSFWHSVALPAVIIEVVQTHLPERHTLFHLLALSERNHLVVLYFIAPGRHATKYSRVNRRTPGTMVVSAAHYLSERMIYENGQAKTSPAPWDADGYRKWVDNEVAPLFARIMKKKVEARN